MSYTLYDICKAREADAPYEHADLLYMSNSCRSYADDSRQLTPTEYVDQRVLTGSNARFGTAADIDNEYEQARMDLYELFDNIGQLPNFYEAECRYLSPKIQQSMIPGQWYGIGYDDVKEPTNFDRYPFYFANNRMLVEEVVAGEQPKGCQFVSSLTLHSDVKTKVHIALERERNLIDSYFNNGSSHWDDTIGPDSSDGIEIIVRERIQVGDIWRPVIQVSTAAQITIEKHQWVCLFKGGNAADPKKKYSDRCENVFYRAEQGQEGQQSFDDELGLTGVASANVRRRNRRNGAQPNRDELLERPNDPKPVV